MKRKRTYRLLLNLCAVALLAFSLYLNFGKREAPGISVPNEVAKAAPVAGNVKEPQTTVTAKTSTQATATSK